MKKAVWLLEAGFLIILSIPIVILPLRWSIKAGEFLGLVLFYAWGSRRRIAIENLRNSISAKTIIISQPVEKIIRDNFKNLGRSCAEIIKIYFGLSRKIINSVVQRTFKRLSQKAKGFYS
jgi:lauroyl/myristoyl acyltransferase